MMDSRIAWLSVGASRTDLDAASSVSLLHSIYGSQLSQLPFSDSDASLTGVQSECLHHQAAPPGALRRVLSRPKSSPAATYLAREQQKLRPASALQRSQRPGTARAGARRPPSATTGRRRPNSAWPAAGGGGAGRRPRTAIGVRRQPSLVVVDEDETAPSLIKDTAPVQLTRVPEYFDFWQGKPLAVRDFGVKVHKRAAWQRPKSDYGNRFLSHSRKKGEGGEGGGGEGEGGLETLLESEGNSGGDDFGRRGGRGLGSLDGEDGERKRGDDGSEGSGSSRWGSGLSDQDQAGRKGRGRHGMGSGQNGGMRDGKGGRGKWKQKLAWDEEDRSAEAEGDQYFKQRAFASTSWLDGCSTSSSRTTRFELPIDLRKLEAMSPVQYLRSHCVVSQRRMGHCSKVFTKLDKDKDLKLNRKEVVAGLLEVLYRCVTEDQINTVLEMIQLPVDHPVDLRLFAAISCFAERTLSLTFLPISQKEVIETVDFEALEWKLRNCTISSSLWALFGQL